MCRIAGIISRNISPEASALHVRSMCGSMKHGGPDDEGFYSSLEYGVNLGHRRLSIIDIGKEGHQPMFFEHDKFVITYNGELYNYLDLKLELQKAGVVFNTSSDTEVILAAYASWGVESFKKLMGMFAFAIWDDYKKSLVVVRDPSGIKPLYYAFSQAGFFFSSEVRAFNSLPYFKEENKNWPVYLMSYGHLPEPITTLKHVIPLEKGSYLLFSPLTNKISCDSFFRYSYLEKIRSHETALSTVQSSIDNAVKRHLVTDTTIGVFLSGGLDSSIISFLANKHQRNLKAVSLCFEDKKYSEGVFQQAMQKKFSFDHQQYLVKENDFHDYLPGIIKAMDLPCNDGINTWFISKYAKEAGLKSVLSGLGGDELFGGYPSFKRVNAMLLLEKLPPVFFKADRFSLSKRFKRLCYLRMQNTIGKYLFLRGQFVPVDIARHLNMDEEQVWEILSASPKVPDISHLSPGNQASWMEMNLYMQNQLLRDADVMSMNHGLEIRVPFLDREVVVNTLKITSVNKYYGGLPKQLLIDAFKTDIPKEIWNRPKMGFSFPFKEWLSNSIYAEEKGGISFSEYQNLMKSGKMHWSRFFTLLLLKLYKLNA